MRNKNSKYRYEPRVRSTLCLPYWLFVIIPNCHYCIIYQEDNFYLIPTDKQYLLVSSKIIQLLALLRKIHTHHAVSLPCSDFSRPRHSTAGTRHGVCKLTPAVSRRPVGDMPRFGFFPTTTRSFTIGSSDFSGYTRTFTKNTALLEDSRGAARRM